MNYTTELTEVFERAESILKEIEQSEITESILFLAILSTPSCYAYKALEEEGKVPFEMYTRIMKKPKNAVKKQRSILIQFSEGVDTVITMAFEEAFDRGVQTINSLDILNIMRANKEGKVAQAFKKLSIKEQEEREEVRKESSQPEIPKILSEHGKSLNELAIRNQLDPIAARETEIDRIINILERRIKNNPCLIGEPGVGKTAIIEGLAQKIVNKQVPDTLIDKIIFSLDIASIVAGCKYRGDFEAKLKGIVKEVANNKNIILFIDEFHLIVGAGGEENSIDASNILKPYISRSQIRIIGATTLSEYKKKIEKDPALERRLQKVLIEEPSIIESFEIIKTLKSKYEEFHKVSISENAAICAVKYSQRYITDRFLPDKAVDVLDEACVHVKINKRKVVEEEDIAFIINQWTGIPIESITKNEAEKLKDLEKILERTVIGQESAIKAISDTIRRSRAGLGDPNRPIGSFLFIGPSGVGKTYLCKTIAKTLFDDENAIIRIDMSEYMEKHSVSKLIGSPPGYVGYDEGGQLTEKIRRKPYSIILLDEIEKANSDVFNMLLQILDEGKLTDSKGRTVDFKNTIIIMTSNLGSEMNSILNKSDFGFGVSTKENQKETLDKNIGAAIKENFRPEFINRIDQIVNFSPLKEEHVIKILDLIIKEFRNKLSKHDIIFTDNALKLIIKKGYNEEYGARPLKRTFQELVENPLSYEIIAKTISQKIVIEEEDSKIIFKMNE